MIPKIVTDNITTINVEYIDFNGDVKNGDIVCNKNIAFELGQIFDEIFNLKFPISKIKPIQEYNNDDMESVRDNNTSCFNFRYVIGSDKLSDHSTGNAIDINPMQNPWIHPSAHKIPGRKYDPSQKGTITKEVIDIFKKHGWGWGGDWRNPDYQHFFKPDMELKKQILSLRESVIRFSNFFIS